MKTSIRLDGFKELDRLLHDLPPNVQNKVLQSAVTGAIGEGKKEIINAAPVGIDPSPASRQYGPLKANIRVARVRSPNPGQRGASVSTGNAFWGAFYELGTRHQPARPWFGQAFARATSKMLDELKKRLGDGIEKEASKLK